MNWLNFHHLMYFWATAKHGSITRACKQLHITPQTVSSQIRTLERVIGEPLLNRTGKSMELTEMGRHIYRYADEIFSIGQELSESLRGYAPSRSMTLHVGIVDALPKLITHHVLEPAFNLEHEVEVVCHVGKNEQLLGRLATHDLDVVLSDTPIPPGLHVRAYNHLLGESTVTLLATTELAKKAKENFPKGLSDVPLLLPTPDSAARQALDRWFEDNRIRPRVVGQFADSAVMKVFGQHGAGVFAVPTVVEAEVRRQYKVQKVAELEDVTEKFYAISVERKVRHPAVVAIYDSARKTLFGGPE